MVTSLNQVLARLLECRRCYQNGASFPVFELAKRSFTECTCLCTSHTSPSTMVTWQLSLSVAGSISSCWYGLPSTSMARSIAYANWSLASE